MKHYLGGRSSLASQPMASEWSGSTGVATISKCPQAKHSNLTSLSNFGFRCPTIAPQIVLMLIG
jgi:hypothetical protein